MREVFDADLVYLILSGRMPVRQACWAVQAGFEAVSAESAQDDAGGAAEAADGPEEGGHGGNVLGCA